MLDWILTIGGLIGFAALGVIANWRAGLPWNDAKPRILPWRLILIFSGFCFFVLVVHLVNLAGIETGPENAMFGRF